MRASITSTPACASRSLDLVLQRARRPRRVCRAARAALVVRCRRGSGVARLRTADSALHCDEVLVVVDVEHRLARCRPPARRRPRRSRSGCRRWSLTLSFCVSKLRTRSEIFRREPIVNGFVQNHPGRALGPDVAAEHDEDVGLVRLHDEEPEAPGDRQIEHQEPDDDPGPVAPRDGPSAAPANPAHMARRRGRDEDHATQRDRSADDPARPFLDLPLHVRLLVGDITMISPAARREQRVERRSAGGRYPDFFEEIVTLSMYTACAGCCPVIAAALGVLDRQRLDALRDVETLDRRGRRSCKWGSRRGSSPFGPVMRKNWLPPVFGPRSPSRACPAM